MSYEGKPVSLFRLHLVVFLSFVFLSTLPPEVGLRSLTFAVLCWLKLVCAFWDGFGSALQEFGDMCTVDLACPCLHGVLLIAPRTRPCSLSATGDAHPSYDLEISRLSAPQPLGPIRASRAMAGKCVRTGDLEPLFLCYWLALDLCDSVSAFWVF